MDMEMGTYCIAHTIRETDPVIKRLTALADKLDQHKISIARPKLGYHITAVPPFRTTAAAAKLVACICDYWDSVMLTILSREDLSFGAYGKGYDFFRNPDVDAFVIRFDVDETVSRAIERVRKKIPEIAEWVYPPENYDFNPHVTIGEGKSIAPPIISLIEQKILLPETPKSIIIRMEAPRVLRKNLALKRWEPVA